MFVRISQIHIFSFMFVHFNKSSVSNFPSKIFKKCELSRNVCTICVHISFSSAGDSRTGAKVAIKKLYRPFQSDIFAKRAYRELRLLKHMKHENVSIKKSKLVKMSKLMSL